MRFTNGAHFCEQNGYQVNGNWYPRVTRIIDIKAKPALYRYYAEAADFESAQKATEKSAEEGTRIHETIQKILIGESPPLGEDIKPAITAAHEFVLKNNIHFVPEFIERRVVHHGQRYAGTIDALAVIEGKTGVLDIKTSSSIYRDYSLQTAAYMEPLIEEVRSVSTRWIFRIDQQQLCERCSSTMRTKGGRVKIRDGRNGAVPCLENNHAWGAVHGISELKEFPFWRHDFDAFLAAKRLWEWENVYWLRQIGYL